MPSVSHDNFFMLWSSTVANDLSYRVGIGLNFAQRLIPSRKNKFLLSLAKNKAKLGLYQCRIKPLTTGYKYTNIIRVSKIIDLCAPSGGSGKHSKSKMHRMAKFNGSSYNILAVASATVSSRSLSLFWYR